MMFRFLRPVALVWLLMAALIGGALLIGHANPHADKFRALGFDTRNGRLSYRGITPGLTKWQEALEILEKEGIQRQDRLIVYYVGNLRVSMSYDLQTDLIVYLEVIDRSFEVTSLTVGDVLSHIGEPCRADPGTFLENGLILNYPHEYITLLLDNRRLDLS